MSTLTIEEIARRAKRDLDSPVNVQIVGQAVSEEISALYAKTKYKALRKLGEMELPSVLGGQINNLTGAPNPNGTVSVTTGSNIVVGDSVAAPLFTNQLEGQYFRVFELKTWYRIKKVDSPNLILENLVVSENNANFPPGTTVTGESYWVAPRFYAAPADARYFGVFTLDYLYQIIEFISPERMQERYPSRFLVGPYPWCVAEFQSNLTLTDKPKMLEFYPAPILATIVHFTYWSTPPKIGYYDSIPTTLDEHIPRQLAHTFIMRYEASRAARNGKVDEAQYWRNEYRAQQTISRELIDEAIRTDSGTDDVTFMVETLRWKRRPPDYDPITSSREDVWSRQG